MQYQMSLRIPNACLREVPSLETLRYEEIDLEGNRLMSLEGFPVGVKRLNVSHNYLLGDGILYPFPHLEELNLSHNNVNVWNTDEFLTCYPSLKKVKFEKNPLKTVEFLRESVVEELDITGCKCKTLCGLPSTVKILKADGNSMTMVQSKLPPPLEVIQLSHNSLHFAGLPLNWSICLRELHLDYNDIEKFPRKLPDGLEILTLNHNNLTSLPTELPSSLHVLTVNSNRIRFLPHYKNHKRFSIFLIEDNCLSSVPEDIKSLVFSANHNWNQSKHHDAQKKIKKCWKQYVLTLRLRHFKRTNTLREELFILSMMPERWEQIDALDPVWYRKKDL
jgi:Leucine-rich repeat (LRR) protein